MRLLASLFTVIDENKFYEVFYNWHGMFEDFIENTRTNPQKVTNSIIQKSTQEYLYNPKNINISELDDFDKSKTAIITILTLYYFYIFENIEILKEYKINEFELIIPNNMVGFISDEGQDAENISNTLINNFNKSNLIINDFFESGNDIGLILLSVASLYNIKSLPVLNRFLFMTKAFCMDIDNVTVRDFAVFRSYLKYVKKHDFKFNFSPLINKDIIYNNIDFIKSLKFTFKFESELVSYPNADGCIFCFHAHELNHDLLSLHYKLNTEIGIDFESRKVYNRELLKTKFALYDYLSSDYETPSTNKISFIESLGNDLENKIERLIDKTNNGMFLYINCDSEYLNDFIIDYITNRISPSKFVEIDYLNRTKNHKSLSNFLKVSNFSDLDISSQMKEWKILLQETASSVKSRTEHGFVLYIDKKLPKSKMIKDRLVGSHYWEYNEQNFRNNFSKILFSIISKRLKLSYLDDKIMTPALYSLIEKNGFYFLVDGLEILPHTLEEVIARSIENNTFDINSSLFWYGIRESYDREIKRPYSLSDLSPKLCLVEFTFLEEKYNVKTINKWQISGLGITEPLDNSIGIITCLCAIYTKNKKIHISHVKTIANYIVKDKSSIERLKNRLSQDVDDLHSDNSTVSELLNKIKSSYKQKKLKGKVENVLKNESELNFANFVKDTISLQDNYVIFNNSPKTKNFIFQCKINHEYFGPEYEWLFDLNLYKKRLQTELKN